MNKNTEKALNNLIIKIDELIDDLEKNEELSSGDRLEQAQVYYNVFKFIKKENFEHNISVLHNDFLKRKFNLRDL